MIVDHDISDNTGTSGFHDSASLKEHLCLSGQSAADRYIRVLGPGFVEGRLTSARGGWMQRYIRVLGPGFVEGIYWQPWPLRVLRTSGFYDPEADANCNAYGAYKRWERKELMSRK